jgi:hypothetical protein
MLSVTGENPEQSAHFRRNHANLTNILHAYQMIGIQYSLTVKYSVFPVPFLCFTAA